MGTCIPSSTSARKHDMCTIQGSISLREHDLATPIQESTCALEYDMDTHTQGSTSARKNAMDTPIQAPAVKKKFKVDWTMKVFGELCDDPTKQQQCIQLLAQASDYTDTRDRCRELRRLGVEKGVVETVAKLLKNVTLRGNWEGKSESQATYRHECQCCAFDRSKRCRHCF